MARGWLIFAGLSGALAVILGAVGAHALEASTEGRAQWDLAMQYHLLHSVLLAGLASTGLPRSGVVRLASWCLAGGMLMFCGTLYFQASHGAPPIANLAPTGGTFLIIGWLLLAVAGVRARPGG
jgi:uncharacterized membrane protein YgdD (TMEM256/DUF423 family)